MPCINPLVIISSTFNEKTIKSFYQKDKLANNIKIITLPYNKDGGIVIISIDTYEKMTILLAKNKTYSKNCQLDLTIQITFIIIFLTYLECGHTNV